MQIIMAQSLLQELMVCKEAAQPVVEAISKLEHNIDIIDMAVSKLESETKQLLQILVTAKAQSSR